MLRFSNILCWQNMCEMIQWSIKVLCAKTGFAQSLATQSSTPIFAFSLNTFHPISFKCGLSNGKRKTAQPLILFKEGEHFNAPECHLELYHPWLPQSQGQPERVWEGGVGEYGWGEQEFKGEAKCSALLMAEKVIFYQSISNDDKTPEGASMLYYCLIHTNLGTTIERGWE